MIAMISHFFGLLIPWVMRFLFGRAVKKAGKEALKKAPVGFVPPNLLLVGILVLGINGLNFLMHLLFFDSTAVPLISTTIITLITAGFLMNGFFCEHTKKERIVLFAILAVIYALFVVAFVVFSITWLALVTKLILEVILGFAVMLAEMNKLTGAQSKVVDTLFERFGIRSDGVLGKLILRFAPPSAAADESFDSLGQSPNDE